MSTKPPSRAALLRALHVPGDPLVLCNVWDAGSAQAVARAGARAIATSSFAMAAAQGYEDGERLPWDLLLRLVEGLRASTSLPLSVDIEGAYARDPDRIAVNVRHVVALGVDGINVEDRIVEGDGLYSPAVQTRRIRAARQGAGAECFINARTDLLFGLEPHAQAKQMEAVVERAFAYAEAGADGLFVPGLTNPEHVAHLVERVSLPVNVMLTEPASWVTAAGVARVSLGPAPYLRAQAALVEAAHTTVSPDK